jgi:transglutaminase-like putative cysteine protease
MPSPFLQRACSLVAVLCVLSGASPVAALDDFESGRHEWLKILLEGSPAGYVHFQTVETDDREIITRIDTHMRIRRLGQVVSLTSGMSTVEDEHGHVIQLGMTTELPAEQRTTAIVQGDVLDIVQVSATGTREMTMDWPTGVRGEAYWRTAVLEWLEAAVVGDTFPTRTFDLSMGTSIDSVYELLSVSEAGWDVSILVEAIPGMRQATTFGRDGRMLSQQVNLGGLLLKMQACDREEALRSLESGAGGRLPAEAFEQTLLRPDVPLPRPRSLDRLLLRLSAKDRSIPFPDFSSVRQRVTSQDDGVLVLEIRRVSPAPQEGAVPPSPASSAPSATIESDDAAVIELAASLVGDERDPWLRALRLERGVYEHISKKSFGVAFASAAEVCRNRTGDCSEHAVLLAGVCRAAGLPARVAMGLVYLGGIFGGHAWTEVWIDDGWVALDATVGLGAVDATHIRFGVSDLAGLGMGVEMYASMMGLSNLDIEVLETEHDGKVRRLQDNPAEAFSIHDRRLQSSVYGFSLDAPAGFVWDSAAPGWASGLVSRARHEQGHQLLVRAEAVAYDFDVESLGLGLSDEALQLPVDVDGRSALLGQRGAWVLRVLDDDTLLELELTDDPDDDIALEWLLAAAKSLRFDD